MQKMILKDIIKDKIPTNRISKEKFSNFAEQFLNMVKESNNRYLKAIGLSHGGDTGDSRQVCIDVIAENYCILNC